jgi:DNA-binding response OmpR family regulator
MDGEYDSLLGLVDTAILEHARKEIQAIYQQPTLAGWLNWVEASLATAVNSKCKLPLSDAKSITRTYYERHFPLRLMPDRQGVWRGPQFLPLDERPYEILKKLFDLKGRSDPNILLEIAGSGENLNTLISRLRREIEPVKGAKIYLQNRRDQGYWLENSVPYSESH